MLLQLSSVLIHTCTHTHCTLI